MIKYSCDKCKKELTEIWDKQEMKTLEWIGGYGSVFGDGTVFRLDLCQECMYALLDAENLIEVGTKENRWDTECI